MHRTFTVRCTWDAEASVWYVEESNVPGLSTEAPTHEELFQKLLALIPELVVLNDGQEGGPHDVPLELLCSRSTSIRVRA